MSVDVVHIGILHICLSYDSLKNRILIEIQKFCVNACIIHLAQLQYILNKHTRLFGVVNVHLLKSREIARSEITAFKTIITLHLYKRRMTFFTKLFQLKLASS